MSHSSFHNPVIVSGTAGVNAAAIRLHEKTVIVRLCAKTLQQ